LDGRSSSCGIAGLPENLDSFEVQAWAYSAIHDEHRGWLGDFDNEIDRDMPMRWLSQAIGLRVIMARQRRAEEQPAQAAGKAAGNGCAVAAVSILPLVAAALSGARHHGLDRRSAGVRSRFS
jgi:hypothetical protein